MNDDDDVPATSLSVMLRVMQHKWLANDHDEAAELARAATPYLHTRPAGNKRAKYQEKEAHRLNDVELARLLARARARHGDVASEADPSVTG